MKRLKYLALATAVAFAACDEGQGIGDVETPITGSIQVTVTAGPANENVTATVTIAGPTTQSAPSTGGSVTFTGLPGGTYAVTLTGIPADYVFTSQSTTTSITTAGETATASFTGSIVATASISGQVTTVSGKAVVGAEVVAVGPSGTRDANTGQAGTYQITGLRSGTYTVTLQADEIGGAECEEDDSTVDLPAGGTAVANFTCADPIVEEDPEPGTIVGQVRSESGQPVGGAQLVASGPTDAIAVSEPSGVYRFEELEAGSYMIALIAGTPGGYACAETEMGPVVLAEGGSAIGPTFECADPAPPDPLISIQSLTQGGVAVNLNSVAGQFEVSLNVDRMGRTLDSVSVLIDDEVVATQVIGVAAGPAGAPALAQETITLNVQSNQVRPGATQGTVVPVVWNGGALISSLIFVDGGSEGYPSNSLPVVMNNPDLLIPAYPGQSPVYGPTTPDPSYFDGANTWYTMGTQLDGEIFLNYSTVNPAGAFTTTAGGGSMASTGSAGCGTSVGTFSGSTTAGMLLTHNWACAGVEGTVAPSYGFGAIDIDYPDIPEALDDNNPFGLFPNGLGPDGSDVQEPSGLARIGAPFMVDDEQRWYVIDNGAGLVAPGVEYVDNKSPEVCVDGDGSITGHDCSIDYVAFLEVSDADHWINDLYNFFDDPDIWVYDGGSGINGSTMQTYVYESSTCTMEAVDTGEDFNDYHLPGTDGTQTDNGAVDGVYLCGRVEDNLAHSATSGPSNDFGIENTVSQVRRAGSTDETADGFLITEDWDGAGGDGDTGQEAIDAFAGANTTIVGGSWPIFNTHIFEGGGEPNSDLPISGFAPFGFAFGLEAIDDRSGFYQGATTAFLPASQSLWRSGPFTSNTCALSTAQRTLGVQLDDDWVRTIDGITWLCGFDPSGTFDWRGHVTDQAGNMSPVLSNTWGIDEDEGAVVTGISTDEVFINPGTDIGLLLFATDDVEIIDIYPGLVFPVATVDGFGTIELTWLADAVNVASRTDGHDPYDMSEWNSIMLADVVTIPAASVLGRIDRVCEETGIFSPPGQPYDSCDATEYNTLPTDSDDYNDQLGNQNNVDDEDDTIALPTRLFAAAEDYGANGFSLDEGDGQTAYYDINPAQWESSVSPPWNSDLATGASGTKIMAILDGSTLRFRHERADSDDPIYFDRVLLLAVTGTFPDVLAVVCQEVSLTDQFDEGFRRVYLYDVAVPAADARCGTDNYAGTGYRFLGIKGAAGILTDIIFYP